MQLFVVDGKDFTHHITVPSYKVNEEQEYEKWTDADYKQHREITRKKISGSFKVLYDVIEELDDFFDTIENLKTESDDGSIEMSVYINNLHMVKVITGFISYTPANEKPFFQKEKVSGFEVKIEER